MCLLDVIIPRGRLTEQDRKSCVRDGKEVYSWNEVSQASVKGSEDKMKLSASSKLSKEEMKAIQGAMKKCAFFVWQLTYSF